VLVKGVAVSFSCTKGDLSSTELRVGRLAPLSGLDRVSARRGWHGSEVCEVRKGQGGRDDSGRLGAGVVHRVVHLSGRTRRYAVDAVDAIGPSVRINVTRTEPVDIPGRTLQLTAGRTRSGP
jgi:hypothetical protein